MSILVTGNLGYVGSVLTEYLQQKGLNIRGIDSGFFKDCITDKLRSPNTLLKDVRDIEPGDISEIECIIHLAALSNDPLGELDSALTFQINFEASARLATIAKSKGVKKFIFVSTQSVYGFADSKILMKEDSTNINPQTAYAKSKWLAEKFIRDLADSNFKVIVLRPSTVFGWSPRLRTDIVFNNLLSNGYFDGRIDIHSDGNPWRPVVHVLDLSKAIFLSLRLNSEFEVFNIGMLNGNYQVKDLAKIAAQNLSLNSINFNTENIVDSRSYRVDFEKSKSILGFHSDINLDQGANEIINKLRTEKFNKNEFLGEKTIRIAKIKNLLARGEIDTSLRFK